MITPEPNLMPWILPGGALDYVTAPDCWERSAHIQRYEFACAATPGMRVLDFGCGAGFGSAMLARECAYVTAVDTDEFALDLGRERHCNYRNLAFEQPRTDYDEFDACVAFEVIEHIDDPAGFIATVPCRHLIASVPVIPTVGHNPFHKHDFTVDSFRALMETRFNINWWWVQVLPFHPEPAVAVFHGERR